MLRHILVVTPLLLVLALPGCGKKKKAATESVEETATDATDGGGGLQRPSQEVMDRVEKAYQEAKPLADQARSFRLDGERLEKAEGMQSAKAKYRKAKQLYQDALGIMEDAMEPELNSDITEEQVDAYLKKYTRELGVWSKSNAAMGKIPE
jgi:hypothetical protein